MKKLILIFSLIASSALSAPDQVPSKAALLATVDHIQRISKNLQANLDKEKAAHAETEKNLVDATSRNVTLQKAIDARSDQLNKAIGERDHILKQLHILKWIVSIAVTAAIAFIILYMAIPPPISFYLGGALIIAANTFIWWKL